MPATFNMRYFTKNTVSKKRWRSEIYSLYWS